MHEARHRLDLVGGGVVVSALAEDIGARRGMGHLSRDIEHARHPVEGVEIVGERLPLPVDALVQRGARDVLDTLHQLDEEVLATRAHRREADSAVAHDDGGDAVPTRRRDVGVPGDLPVVVGVDVDPSRREHEPAGVDLTPPSLIGLANRGDATGVDGHVAGAPRCAGAVDDRGVPYDQIVHGPGA